MNSPVQASPHALSRRTSGHIMALVMAAIIVAGFSMQLAMGRSSFSAPPLVHFHAVIFFGWVVIYVTQSALVTRGSMPLHRRLGWLAAARATTMVLTISRVSEPAERPPMPSALASLAMGAVGAVHLAHTPAGERAAALLGETILRISNAESVSSLFVD